MPKSKPVPIKINLLPRDPFFSTPLGKTLRWALAVGRYIVIFTELVVIMSFMARFSLDRQLTDLNDSIHQKQVVVQSYGNLEQSVRAAQEKMQQLDQIDQIDTIVDVFPQLSTLTPPSINLTEMTIKPGQLFLSGISPDRQAFNILINNLQLSPNFVNLNVISIENKANSSELTFQLEAETQVL